MLLLACDINLSGVCRVDGFSVSCCCSGEKFESFRMFRTKVLDICAYRVRTRYAVHQYPGTMEPMPLNLAVVIVYSQQKFRGGGCSKIMGFLYTNHTGLGGGTPYEKKRKYYFNLGIRGTKFGGHCRHLLVLGHVTCFRSGFRQNWHNISGQKVRFSTKVQIICKKSDENIFARTTRNLQSKRKHLTRFIGIPTTTFCGNMNTRYF